MQLYQLISTTNIISVCVQIVLGMMFPILSIAFLIAPKSKLGRLMANPTVKFWCWLMSEVVFVVMLLVNTIMMHYNVFDGLNSVRKYFFIFKIPDFKSDAFVNMIRAQKNVSLILAKFYLLKTELFSFINFLCVKNDFLLDYIVSFLVYVWVLF